MTDRLSLVSTQTATTYCFRAAPGTFGWANCTVNDATGELLITSDWGNWSHRWSPDPKHLGSPSLRAFIGTRGRADYLARKLQGGGGEAGRRWSAAATARALRRRLCEQRRDHGRKLMLRVEQATLNARYGVPLPFLTRDDARRIWDEIGDVLDMVGNSRDLFYEHVLEIDGFARFVAEDPWEHAETEQTPEDRALRDIVLPALIDACRASVSAQSDEFDATGGLR